MDLDVLIEIGKFDDDITGNNWQGKNQSGKTEIKRETELE